MGRGSETDFGKCQSKYTSFSLNNSIRLSRGMSVNDWRSNGLNQKSKSESQLDTYATLNGFGKGTHLGQAEPSPGQFQCTAHR